jgi:phosphatidylglycerol:prolipoprotein diacylglycerol transferase
LYPKLFEIGPVPVYSYGLFLGLTFIVGSILFNRELKRNGYSENIGANMVFLCLIGGIIGSKLFYVLEEWNFSQTKPLSSFFTKEMLLSPSGLTFYGGLLLAIILVSIYSRSKKIPVLKMFDLMSPAAALGYGIARIGCHLSGDGDYGTVVNGTFWEFIGYSYANGTVPTKPGELVHPTSVYELVAAILIFTFLWRIRKDYAVPGIVFAYYLILSGIERFLIEFIRLNPIVVAGMSQAQLISLGMMITGILLLISRKKLEKQAETVLA